ncbi:MAG: DUF1674 domain-containing protein [Gammaproteobacteria bacterium]|nr:DUF1674 domain-containing protein [Gammaproteobacteria bacterium]
MSHTINNKERARHDDLAPAGAERPHSPDTPGKNQSQKEIGGPAGPEPTRYGDWERRGRCIDF